MAAGDLTPLRDSGTVAGGIDLDLPGDGVRLRGTRWSGTGLPIVLLHGLASQRRFWNLVVSRLAGLPMLTIDARGHGDSERPETGYETEVVVRDVLTAMDAVGMGRAVVVGHSWGGSVAATLAAEYPMRAAAVVLIDGGFATPLEHLPREQARELLRPPAIDIPAAEFAERVRAQHARFWSAEVEEAVLPIFGVDAAGHVHPRLPLDRHMQIVDALLSYDASTTLRRIECACWAVSCESHDNDEWSRRKEAAMRTAAGLLKSPRLLRWQSAEHDVPLQWPALVAGLIRQAVDDANRLDGKETP